MTTKTRTETPIIRTPGDLSAAIAQAEAERRNKGAGAATMHWQLVRKITDGSGISAGLDGMGAAGVSPVAVRNDAAQLSGIQQVYDRIEELAAERAATQDDYNREVPELEAQMQAAKARIAELQYKMSIALNRLLEEQQQLRWAGQAKGELIARGCPPDLIPANPREHKPRPRWAKVVSMTNCDGVVIIEGTPRKLGEVFKFADRTPSSWQPNVLAEVSAPAAEVPA